MLLDQLLLNYAAQFDLDSKIAKTRLERFHREEKGLRKKRAIQIAIGAIFLSGLFTLGNQEMSGYIEKGNVFVELIRVIAFGFGTHGGSLITTIVIAVMGYLLWYLFKMRQLFTKQVIDEELNLILADEGTMGSAHEMTETEFGRYYQRTPIEESVDYIVGTDFSNGANFKNSGAKDTAPIDHVIEILTKENGGETGPHKCIFGPSGCGKTYGYMLANIVNSINKGKSVFITDPKGELYSWLSYYAMKKGAHVGVLNLMEPMLSDGVNFVSLIGKDESMAQTIAAILITNSNGDEKTKRDFWTNGGLALTTFGLLFVAMQKDLDPKYKTLGKVYELLTEPGEEDMANVEVDSFGNPVNATQKNSAVFNKLERLVATLPASHPAKKQWNLFMGAPPNARDSVFMDVGTRLNVLNDSVLTNVMSHNDIDLELPMKEQCVYFIITDTESDRYDAIASMFFSLSFYKLCRYAKKHAKRIPVDFFLDEFPSIGTIPNFVKLISLVRSNNMEINIVAQDIGQLIEKYPGHTWESILSNCDTQIVLGVNDHNTNGKYWSEKTGDATVYSVQHSRAARGTLGMNASNSNEREGAIKRSLYTVDEVMRMKGHGRQGTLVFTAYAPVKLVRKVGFGDTPTGKMIMDNEKEYLYQHTPYHHRPKWWDEIEEQKKKDIHHVKDFDWFDGMMEEIESNRVEYENNWMEKLREENEQRLLKERLEEAREKIESERAKTLEEIAEERIQSVKDNVKGKVTSTLHIEKAEDKVVNFEEKKAQFKDKALDFIYAVLREERPETQDKEALRKLTESKIRDAVLIAGEVVTPVSDDDMTDGEITDAWSFTKTEYANADEIIKAPDAEEKETIEASKASREEAEFDANDVSMEDPFAQFFKGA